MTHRNNTERKQLLYNTPHSTHNTSLTLHSSLFLMRAFSNSDRALALSLMCFFRSRACDSLFCCRALISPVEKEGRGKGVESWRGLVQKYVLVSVLKSVEIKVIEGVHKNSNVMHVHWKCKQLVPTAQRNTHHKHYTHYTNYTHH